MVAKTQQLRMVLGYQTPRNHQGVLADFRSLSGGLRRLRCQFLASMAIVMTVIVLFLTLIALAISFSPMRPPYAPSKKGQGEGYDDD